MRMTLFFLFIALLSALSGCCLQSQFCEKQPRKQPGVAVAAPPYNQTTLYNFYLGRTYMAQGRYELARQRLLLSMATAENPEMRAKLAQEIEAADKMIQTMR